MIFEEFVENYRISCFFFGSEEKKEQKKEEKTEKKALWVISKAFPQKNVCRVIDRF